MYLNKKFEINESLKKQIHNKGYLVVQNYFEPNFLRKINSKINRLLVDQNNFLPPRDIKFYKKQTKKLKSPNGTLKKTLDKKILSSGYKKFKYFTNGVSYRDPLLKIRNLKKIVFDEKFIKLMSYLIGGDIKLGPLKMATYFNNKLPKNCINYFHSDHLTADGKKMSKCLKVSISLNTGGKIGGEYMHIAKRKSKLKFNKQYFEKKLMTPELKDCLVIPKLSLGDVVVFDPTNFYHAAAKPKNKRNMLYLEYTSKNNKNVPFPTNIFKTDYKKLSKLQKKLASSFIKS